MSASSSSFVPILLRVGVRVLGLWMSLEYLKHKQRIQNLWTQSIFQWIWGFKIASALGCCHNPEGVVTPSSIFTLYTTLSPSPLFYPIIPVYPLLPSTLLIPPHLLPSHPISSHLYWVVPSFSHSFVAWRGAVSNRCSFFSEVLLNFLTAVDGFHVVPGGGQPERCIHRTNIFQHLSIQYEMSFNSKSSNVAVTKIVSQGQATAARPRASCNHISAQIGRSKVLGNRAPKCRLPWSDGVS